MKQRLYAAAFDRSGNDSRGEFFQRSEGIFFVSAKSENEAEKKFLPIKQEIERKYQNGTDCESEVSIFELSEVTVPNYRITLEKID